MTRWKTSARSIIDRFVQHYFDHQTAQLSASQGRLEDELHHIEDALHHIEDALPHLEDALHTHEDALADALQTRAAELDVLQRLLAEQLAEQVTNFQRDVIYQFEGQAQRQAELRGAMEEQARAVEALVLGVKGRLDDFDRSGLERAAGLGSELVELARMLRMQGDAADQVAEVLGRTIARLSAEVDQLSEALHAAVPEPVPPL